MPYSGTVRCNAFRRRDDARHRPARNNQQSASTVGSVVGVQTTLRYERWYLALSVPLGLGPERSELRVEAGRLHVKMGWAFDAHIPLTSITAAEATSARVFAWGVHYSGGRWLVNGSAKGLVALTIEPPARAKFWKMSVPLRSLWISVTDPGALIAACHVPSTNPAADG